MEASWTRKWDHCFFRPRQGFKTPALSSHVQLSSQASFVFCDRLTGLRQRAPEPLPGSGRVSRSMPVVLFAAVQRSDLLHLLRCQLKTEQIKVLADVVRVG